jgi:Ca2+-binding EF-hand superfamily protein
MIRQFDKDGNGNLAFDEFEEMMKPKIYDSLLEQDDRD